MGIDDAKTGGSHGLPWRLLGAVLVLKILVLSSLVPAPTVWWDESLLFSTAHDLAHLGSAEGPHANFLFYPPLTSAVTAPLHLLGLPGTWTYRLSLVVLSVFLWTAAVAMLLLYRELTQAFGGVADRERVPWPLAAILVSSSVFYLGFQLMSEPLFVAAYAWFLLSLFRFLVRREPRQAVLAGVAASLMVLGRGAGIGIPLVGLGVLVADAAMELWGRSKTGWRKLAPHLWILALPSITHTVWHRVDEHFQDVQDLLLGSNPLTEQLCPEAAANPPIDPAACFQEAAGGAGGLPGGDGNPLAPALEPFCPETAAGELGPSTPTDCLAEAGAGLAALEELLAPLSEPNTTRTVRHMIMRSKMGFQFST